MGVVVVTAAAAPKTGTVSSFLLDSMDTTVFEMGRRAEKLERPDSGFREKATKLWAAAGNVAGPLAATPAKLFDAAEAFRGCWSR
jgi:hypothetical protein